MDNLDSRLLNRGQEEDQKRENSRAEKLWEAKRQSFDRFKESSIGRGIMSTASVVDEDSASEAVRQGVSYGLYLRKSIQEGGLTGGNFIALLLLSICKDVVDFFGLGWMNPVKLFLIIALFIINSGKGAFFKRFIIKRFFIYFSLEMIPLIDFFPIMTIGTIIIKIGMDRKIKKMKEELKEVEKQTAESSNGKLE